MLATSFILNRSPIRGLHEKTLEEAWFGSKLNVSHIKIFGSLCFKHVPVK